MIVRPLSGTTSSTGVRWTHLCLLGPHKTIGCRACCSSHGILSIWSRQSRLQGAADHRCSLGCRWGATTTVCASIGPPHPRVCTSLVVSYRVTDRTDGWPEWWDFSVSPLTSFATLEQKIMAGYSGYRRGATEAAAWWSIRCGRGIRILREKEAVDGDLQTMRVCVCVTLCILPYGGAQ